MSTKPRPSATEPFLTVAEAAEQLSVHPSTIRRWIDQGRLTAYRLGEKRIGVRPSDLAKVAVLRPPRQSERLMQSDRPVIPPPTRAEQRRGLRALAELERMSAEIAVRHGKLAPESWEVINQARDERTRELMQAVEE